MLEMLLCKIMHRILKANKSTFICIITCYLKDTPPSSALWCQFLILFWIIINNLTEIHSILGHPKTKAFITHGGTNGIYEAIYHGIPMVGLPLFADQPDNIVRVKAKGAAVRVDLETMSSRDLLNALKEVINNPSWVYLFHYIWW